jgi:hypothetical protein
MTPDELSRLIAENIEPLRTLDVKAHIKAFGYGMRSLLKDGANEMRYWQHDQPLRCPVKHLLLWLGGEMWLCEECKAVYVSEEPTK